LWAFLAAVSGMFQRSKDRAANDGGIDDTSRATAAVTCGWTHRRQGPGEIRLRGAGLESPDVTDDQCIAPAPKRPLEHALSDVSPGRFTLLGFSGGHGIIEGSTSRRRSFNTGHAVGCNMPSGVLAPGRPTNLQGAAGARTFQNELVRSLRSLV
jgi:hypothetical protein